MPITAGERIRIIMKRRGLTVDQLAEACGWKRTTLSSKFSRDDFTEKELQTIANALNCTYDCSFIMRDTFERI